LRRKCTSMLVASKIRNSTPPERQTVLSWKGFFVSSIFCVVRIMAFSHEDFEAGSLYSVEIVVARGGEKKGGKLECGSAFIIF